MKISSVVLSCVIGVLSFNSMAQSTFVLRNYSSDLNTLNAPVFNAEGTGLSGTNYAAELWGGVTSDSLSPALDLNSSQRVFVPFLTGIGAGYFTSYLEMTVFQVGGGDFAWVQVRAWDARLGATYEDVAALGMGGYGESLPFYAQGGNPTYVPPELPRLLFGLQSFSLRPIPEPSVWQLSLLGLPAMLLLRRKGGFIKS